MNRKRLSLPCALAFYLQKLTACLVIGTQCPSTAQELFLRSGFETEEGFKLGNLHEQKGWIVEQGEATVVASEGRSTSQVLEILPSDPAGRVSLSVPLPADASGGGTVIYSDVWVRPGAVESSAGTEFFGAGESFTGFFRIASGGELFIFNGDGQGGGQWLASGAAFPVSGDGQAQDWIRLSLRQDLNARVWDLFINGSIFRANMGFWKDAETAAPQTSFVFTGHTGVPLLLDDLAAGTESLLFADVDRDGLPDDWEAAQGLTAVNGGRDDDPDGDGVTNVEELVLGTKALTADSDGDGLSDGEEVLAGRNPALKERRWESLNLATPEMPDAEILRHGLVLAVPFILDGPASPADCNAALRALDAYAALRLPEKVEGLEQFLQENPQSPFRRWIKAHAACTAWDRSRFGKALPLLEELWKSLPQADGLSPQGAVRSLVGTKLAAAYHLYGRTEEMGAVLEALDRAGLPGGISERVFHLKAEHWAQKNRPELANRCGFSSLAVFADAVDPAAGSRFHAREAAPGGSKADARNLGQLSDLASSENFGVRPALRPTGAEWVVPSLIHWKAGHFSVLAAKQKDGRYLILDPAANTRRVVSTQTMEEETSGACLVSGNDLPAGWSPMDRTAAEAFTGRSSVISEDDCKGKAGCSSCEGVAEADFNLFRASLVVGDTPLVDTPPRGPGLSVHATWSQHSTSVLHTLSYPSLGSGTNWTLGFGGAHIDEGFGGNRNVFDESGNRTTHTWDGTNYLPQLLTGDTLEGIYSGATFLGFRLHSQDGSYEEYFQAGKETGYDEDKRYFLTQKVDAQGISVATFTYETGGLKRLSSITGPAGSASLSFSYYGSTDYRIYSITDSRSGGTSRACYFYYDSSNRLQTLYDVLGIASSFGYSGSFLNSLTTPYGTSSFNSVVFSTGNFGRYLDLTDARGWTQRVLFAQYLGAGFPGREPDTYDAAYDEIPSAVTVPLAITYGLTSAGASWHWDKKMMQDYPPGDPAAYNYTNFEKARHTHWMQNSTGVTGSLPASERNPEDGGYRTFYTYKDQLYAGQLNGSSDVAQRVNRVHAWNPSTSAMEMMDRITSYTYNGQGNILTSTDPRGRITKYEYDSTGMDLRYTKQQEGTGTWKVLEERIYGGTGASPHQPTTIKSASGDATIFQYNSFGQPTLITNPKAEKTRTNYDSNGWLTSIEKTDPANASLWVTVYTVNARDAFKRVSQDTDADGYTKSYTFDALNRTTLVQHPDSTTEQYWYINNATSGARIELGKSKDRGGNYTKYNYNANRDLSSKVDALNQTISYEYCRCAGLYSLTDERGKVTRWNRDLNGRVTSKQYHNSKYVFYYYEPESGLLSTVDFPKDVGVTLTQTYFIDGNLRKIDHADSGTPDVTLNYDTWYSRMTSRTDGAGTWTYAYKTTSTAPSHPSTANGAGQIASIDGPWGQDTMTYSYDDAGRLTSRSMSNGSYYNQTWSESLTLDSLGRLKSTPNGMGTWNHSFIGNSVLVDKITTSISNAVREVDYDYLAASSGRFLSRITIRKTAGGTLISQHDYTCGTGTEFGQIKTWHQQLPTNSTPSDWASTTQTFGYDAIGQLGSGAETGLPTRTYAYDAAGNRTSKSEAGTGTAYGTANDVNQIATASGGDGATSVYDDNGNLTSIIYADGSRRLMEWDGINRLKRLTIQAGASEANGDKRVDFTYNAFSQRATQSVATRGASSWGAATVDYYRWDGDRIIQMRRGSSSSDFAISYYPQGFRVHYYGSTDLDYFYTRDHLGSVYEVLNGSSGIINAAYSFTPYGERLTRFGGTSEWDTVAYTGHFILKPSTAAHQAAGQLSLTWYRAYDPRMGTWLSRDRIEEQGGINLYGFCYNSPQNWVDDTGMVPVPGFEDLGDRQGRGGKDSNCASRATDGKSAFDATRAEMEKRGCTQVEQGPCQPCDKEVVVYQPKTESSVENGGSYHVIGQNPAGGGYHHQTGVGGDYWTNVADPNKAARFYFNRLNNGKHKDAPIIQIRYCCKK